MKNIKPVNILNIICSVFVILIMYYIICPLFISSPPIYESLIDPFRSIFPWITTDNPFFVFFSNEHPYCILSVFSVLTNKIIPELLRTHPINYILNYNYFILILCFILQLFSIKENFVKYFADKKFTSLITLLILPFYIFIMFQSRILFATEDDGWGYAYFLLPTFAYVFFSELEFLYVKEAKLTKRKLFSLILLFIFVSVSNEIFKLMLCSGLLIVYILHIMFVNKNINHKKFWLIYIPSVCILLQNLVNPMFTVWISSRYCDYSINQIIGILPDYLYKMFNLYVINNIVPVCTLVILFVLLFFSPKNESRKRLLIFALTVLSSLFITLISFILGYEQYENATYMFEHIGMIFITNIIIFNLILSILGYIIAVQDKKYMKILLFTSAFSLLIFTHNVMHYSFSKYKSETVRDKEVKTRQMYILERLFIDYGRENKIFYYSKSNDFVGDISLNYFKNLYDRATDINEYQYGVICNDDDDFSECENKLLKFTEEKTGYKIRKRELQKHDFSIYNKYIVWM